MNRRSRPVEVENGYVDLSGTPALDVDLTGMHVSQGQWYLLGCMGYIILTHRIE